MTGVQTCALPIYHYALVETTLTEDKWIQAYEVQPTAREVVHHVLVFARPPGASGERDFGRGRDEGMGFFAAYAPGNNFRIFPEGYAKKLPAGTRLRFQIHYTPNGKVATDRTRLGLKFASHPPERAVQVAAIANPLINIPPGAASHVETAQLSVPADVYLTTLMPHMHLRGKAFKFEAEFPGGARRVLLDVPRYDFNWQYTHQLAEPMKLPAGTVIHTTAVYDNSAANPANPNPAVTVRWGDQTVEEMMLGYVEYFVPAKHSPKVAHN